MSGKPVAPIKTLARYEPDTVYIGTGEYVAECVRADDGDYYLAADVDAVIEALRAEVERLRTDGASAVRWAPGSAYWSEVLVELFGPDARKGIDVLEARWRKEIERAERLEAELKEIRSRSAMNLAMRSDQFELTARLGDIYQIADAALSNGGKA